MFDRKPPSPTHIQLIYIPLCGTKRKYYLVVSIVNKKMKETDIFLYDLSHEQVTVNNVIRQEKVAEYDIKDDQNFFCKLRGIFY